MPTILVLGSYAPSLITFRGHLLQALRSKGLEVVACAPDADESVIRKLKEWGVQYAGVRIERTGMNPFSDLLLVKRYLTLFRSIRPDVILPYTVKPVIYGSIAARFASVPIKTAMITGLGYAFMGKGILRKALNQLVRFLYKFALSKSQLVFFQNQDDQDLFNKLSLLNKKSKQVVLNGSGVDTKYFSTAQLPATPAFLMIARLIGEKGVREYAEAARIVKKEYPSIPFYLAGWIDDTPSAISQKELNSWVDSSEIEFLGKLEDVREGIKQCTVYVLPSYREGTPRTVLEAMAMGRPIITTDTPGCRQTTEDGRNGLLVPIQDVTTLADAMRFFITNTDHAKVMGKESRRIAVEKYDVNKVNLSIIDAIGLKT